MTSSPTDHESFRQLVNDRRGEQRLSLRALAESSGFGSQQHLSQKLLGQNKFTPPEVVRLAEALQGDALEFAQTLWPGLAEADPVPAELRRILSGANATQRKRILVAAREIAPEQREVRAQAAHRGRGAAAPASKRSR